MTLVAKNDANAAFISMQAEPGSNNEPSRSETKLSISKVEVPWRENFIPYHPRELQELLLHTLTGPLDRESVASQLDSICRRVLERNRRLHDDLLYTYRSLDPDQQSGEEESNASTNLRASELVDSMEKILRDANYHRLTPLQVLSAIRTATQWGVRLRVRLSMFRHLRVYARGDMIGLRSRRAWYRFFRLEELEVPTYEQLVVLFQPKRPITQGQPLSSNALHLRMFKNVPHADIDMLFPISNVRFTWLDRGKIGLPTMWGFVLLASKLAKNIWLVTLLSALKFVTSLALIVAIAIALIVSAIKGLFSFRYAQNRYMLNVTQNLYYQTMSNNAGVLLRLIDEAKQQEACEAILAMYALRIKESLNPTKSFSESELDEYCEEILLRIGARPIDFDIDDALRDLAEMRLITRSKTGWQRPALTQSNS